MSNITIRRQQQNIDVSQPRSDYHLPIASDTILGGIKVGNNLSITLDGTLSAVGEGYSLPVASASTLGGIKVGDRLSISDDGVLSAVIDSTLSTQSNNPVYNSTVTSALNSLGSTTDSLDDRLDTVENNLSTLSSTVTAQGLSISGITSDISTMTTDISNNTNAISTNATNIGTVSGNLTQLSSTVNTLSGTVTDQGNALSAVIGEVNDFTISTDTDVEYSYLLPINTWSAGKITYSQRGKILAVQFDLTGTYALQSQVLSQIYQLPNTIIPTVPSYGTLITDDGDIEVTIDTSGNIKFYNHTSQTQHISKIRGQVIVVLA